VTALPVEGGEPVRRVALVVGTTEGGTGTHVRMLAAGCAARGVTVSVLGPSATAARLGLASLPGVTSVPVEFGDRPRPRDALALFGLRRSLLPAGASAQPGAATGPPDVVHAHGLRAGALAVLALGRLRRRERRSPALVATVHNAPPSGGGVSALIYGLLERLVARGADQVLCVSPDIEERMRAAGARQAGRAIVSAATAPPFAASSEGAPSASASLGTGRPVVLAAGRLAAQKGFGTLLTAAASWRDMSPEPLLVIAGDGPLSAQLRAKASSLGVAAQFLGHRDDVPALLAQASVFVLPSLWEGQPLVLQEALRAGVPIVASRAGGIPGLAGDAALLVPPADAGSLSAAVRSVLCDPALAARLRDAARLRGTRLPSEKDAVAAALACYAEVMKNVRDTG
jgi:glycosyltransferase involved in cell wall biosynthesis